MSEDLRYTTVWCPNQFLNAQKANLICLFGFLAAQPGNLCCAVQQPNLLSVMSAIQFVDRTMYPLKLMMWFCFLCVSSKRSIWLHSVVSLSCYYLDFRFSSKKYYTLLELSRRRFFLWYLCTDSTKPIKLNGLSEFSCSHVAISLKPLFSLSSHAE